MDDDNKVCFNKQSFFNLHTQVLDNIGVDYECGLTFDSSYELGDGTSVESKKDIKLDSAQETVSTYQKVVEVYELTDGELAKVNGFRKFFRAFNEHIKEKGYKPSLLYLIGALQFGFGTYDLFNEDYFMAAIFFICFGFNVLGTNLGNYIEKYWHYNKKVEQYKEELSSKGISNEDISLMSSTDDVQMYTLTK